MLKERILKWLLGEGKSVPHEIEVLKTWLKQEREEKEFYRSLLLKQVGLVVEEAAGSSPPPSPIGSGRRSWPRIKQELEAVEIRRQREYWEKKVQEKDVKGAAQ